MRTTALVQGVTRRWVVAWSFLDLGSSKPLDEEKVFKKKRKRNLSAASFVIGINVINESKEEPKLNRAARRKLMMILRKKEDS